MSGISRRTVAKTAAWVAPAIALSVASPAAASSVPPDGPPLAAEFTSPVYSTVPDGAYDESTSGRVALMVTSNGLPVAGATVIFTIGQQETDSGDEDGLEDDDTSTGEDDTTTGGGGSEPSATFAGGVLTEAVVTDASGLATPSVVTVGHPSGLLAVTAIVTRDGNSATAGAILRISQLLALQGGGYNGAPGATGIGVVGRNTTLPVAVGLAESVATEHLGHSHGDRGFIVDRDHQVWGWGRGTYYALEPQGRVNRSAPVLLDLGAEVAAASPVQVEGTYFNTSVLTATGEVFSWGDGRNGLNGDGRTSGVQRSVPSKVRIDDVIKISGGYNTMYAVRGDNTVWAWGYGGNGARGDGGTNAAGGGVPVRVQLPTAEKWIQVAGKTYGGIALAESGLVYAWGTGAYRSLGDGRTGTGRATIPVRVSGIDSAVSIAANRYQLGAVLADTTVRTWGRPSSRALGNGTTAAVYAPVSPTYADGQQLDGVTKLAFGDNSSMALLMDGSVVTWGRPNYGQLANGTTNYARNGSAYDYFPRKALFLKDVTDIASSRLQNWAVTKV